MKSILGYVFFFHLIHGCFHGYRRNNNKLLNLQLKRSTFQHLLQLLKLYWLRIILKEIEVKQPVPTIFL